MKQAVSTTMTVAPTTVPIIRNHPLRSDAPRLGCQTIPADVPAQYAPSSWSQKAMYRARHTDADNRRPKISAGAAVPAARRSDSIVRSVLQSCPVTGEGGSIVLVRIRLGLNLAM